MLVSSAGSHFSLAEELLSSLNRSGELLLTPKEIEKKLNAIEDVLMDDPKQIVYDSMYFELKDLISSFAELGVTPKMKLLGLLQSSFGKLVSSLKTAMTQGKSSFEAADWRNACEMYAAALNFAVIAAENATSEKKPVVTSGKGKAADKAAAFDWTQIRYALLENIHDFVSLQLGRVFDSSAARESVVSCFVKATHRVLENPENVKSINTRRVALEVLVECATSQGYCQGLQTILQQDLIYFEHLAEPTAELFKQLFATEDPECIKICEDILKQLGSHRFSSQDSSNSTKIAAVFLVKFSACAPKDTLHSLSLFVDLIDSEAYVIRMAMIEVIGMLILHLMNQEDRSDSVKAQTKSLFVALEERFHDVNSFVRSKAIQVCCDLAKSSSIPINKRPKLLQLAIERVMDKSSNVRKRAIQLLGDFLRTHPFAVDGGELNLAFFQSRLADIDRLLNEMTPPEVGKLSLQEDGVDADDVMTEATEESNIPTSSVANSAQIGVLLAQKQYYTDAVKFVSLINEVVPTICMLLSSSTKSEVFEVMEFLVEAHIYKLECANEGIRKMLHLIWERELSAEDGTKQSIKEHVIENYRKIYLYADESLSVKDRAIEIAKNLVSMIDGITIAELASLSELFSSFMKKNYISEAVLNQVFAIFASNEAQRRERRSALIILSLAGRSRREVVEKRLDLLLRIGLGTVGQSDPLIAQFTLKSLQCLAGSKPEESFASRLPRSNVLFERILTFINSVGPAPRWYSVLQEAVNTIFVLADAPLPLASSLLTEQCKVVFTGERGWSNCDHNELCKLLLLIGQVASCVSEHLDLVERHGKDSAQKLDASRSAGADADLAKVSASAEDDFAELVKGVREHEVLFSQDSILSTLAPLVAFICGNNVTFRSQRLQRIATLALGKLMCISSVFCERNLQLFLTILERSDDAVIRSNMVIAFGDLAQAFNRVVDQNIDYLFARLRDSDLTVRRNSLMVLTHLSLCGMIKVKGQIGEIAKCLIDEDERIRGLARIFFAEMADRDAGQGNNGIYNHIPDILSHLSATASGVGEEAFRSIMKFIFDFIKKERQMENLIEKLCARFRQSDEIRHARDLAFCLSLISFSGERALRKLIEALPAYQDKLVDEAVLASFVEIVTRSRKTCRAEAKAILDEFENRLLAAANGNLERGGEALASFAALAQSTRSRANSTASAGAEKAKPKPKSKAKAKSKVRYDVSDDDEDDDVDEEDLVPIEPTRRAASTRKSSNSVKFFEEEPVEKKPSGRKRAIVSDAEDDDDIF